MKEKICLKGSNQKKPKSQDKQNKGKTPLRNVQNLYGEKL